MDGEGGHEAETASVASEGHGRADLEKQVSEDQEEMHQARKSKVERGEAGSEVGERALGARHRLVEGRRAQGQG